MTFTNSDLINSVIKEVVEEEGIELYKWQVEYIIKKYVNTICTELSNGNNIKIDGFGSFTYKFVKGGDAVNVRTGKKMNVKDRIYIRFKPSKKIK